jgi:hypothetical protein
MKSPGIKNKAGNFIENIARDIFKRPLGKKYDKSKSNRFALLTTMYDEENPLRRDEFQICLEKNLNHPLIDKIYVFFEIEEPTENELFKFIKSKKNNVEIILIKKKPTFELFFNFANKNLEGKNIIIANADIYFDDTLHKIEEYDFTNKFFVLTRWNLADDSQLYLQGLTNVTYPWEKISEKEYIKNPDLCNKRSADAWIFKTPFVIDSQCNYHLGAFKCDSLLNYSLFQKQARENFNVFNPCFSIRACHLDKNINNKSLEGYREFAERNYSQELNARSKDGLIKWCFLEDTIDGCKAGKLSARLKEIRKSTIEKSTGGVLIYCADITGHRHLYSAYFIRYFLECGYVVYFCYAGKIGKFLSRGRLGYERVESPYLEIFQEESRVHLINICHELDGVKNELNFIRKLQEELEPGVSLFIDGDILKHMFLRQLLPWQKRLSGNNFSFICLSEFIYATPGIFQALKELWLFIYYHLTNRHIFVHRVNFVAKFPLLNKFFFRCIRRFNLLTAVFCPDVGLVEQLRNPRVLFLPEPDTNALQAKNTAKKSSFYARVKSQYQDFLERNRGKHVLLMFGDLESRKGYDLLLQLAARDHGCVCVRFGRTKGDYTATWAAILGKEKLIVEDRLFELDIYVESKELMDFIFSTVRFMVLPYKQYYRTSGVLIDVLRRGLPVLTPDKGAMARIVKYYQVGRVFPDGNFQELQKEFSGFKEDYKSYLKNIEKFNIDYSKKKCEEILSVMLKNEKI